MLCIYRFLMVALWPVWIVVGLGRLVVGKETGQSLLQKWGLLHTKFDKIQINSNKNGQVLWFHAVSIGEMQAGIPLIQSFLMDNPNIRVILTTQTLSSYMVWKSWRKRHLDQNKMVNGVNSSAWVLRMQHQFMPHDIGFLWGRFLRHWNPEQCFVIENDIWPNMVRMLHQKKIPMTLLNAKLSPKSLALWQKVPSFSDCLWPKISHILAGSMEDAKRLAVVTKRDIHYASGNLKYAQFEKSLYDMAYAAKKLSVMDHGKRHAFGADGHNVSKQEIQAYNKENKGDARFCRLVFANIHPHECAWIAEFLIKLYHSPYIKDVDLLLIPRHIHKAGAMKKKLRQLLRDKLSINNSSHVTIDVYENIIKLPKSPYPGAWDPNPLQVPILAAFGCNRMIYHKTDIVVVGGSLAPHNGHNPFEPQCDACIVAMGSKSTHFPAMGIEEKQEKGLSGDYVHHPVLNIFHVDKPNHLLGLVTDFLLHPDDFDHFLKQQAVYLEAKKQKILSEYRDFLKVRNAHD